MVGLCSLAGPTNERGLVVVPHILRIGLHFGVFGGQRLVVLLFDSLITVCVRDCVADPSRVVDHSITRREVYHVARRERLQLGPIAALCFPILLL